MSNLEFPEGFIWGASTSSHQVEGGNVNDWSAWEEAGRVRNKDVSGLAADHWNHYESDFDILEQLHLNAYRFSIEWSRVEPVQGEFNPNAAEHYKDMLISLHERGIEPFVTLHHFTNPQWVGDWTHSQTVDAYLNYVQHIVNMLGDQVSTWCTINEPNILATLAYQLGWWPPGKKNSISMLRALLNLIKAHNKAYDLINEIYETNGWDKPKISMAFNLQHYQAVSNNPILKLSARVATYTANGFTMQRVRKKLDYIGVNYYFSHRVGKDKGPKPPKNDLGWDMRPLDVYPVLMRLKKFNLPLYVVETGQPDAKDSFRGWWIVQGLTGIHRAIADGADVKGYLHWSLLDNFEWQEGYAGRFGLVAVNFKTQERTVRGSAKMYGEIAKANNLSQALQEKYS